METITLKVDKRDVVGKKLAPHRKNGKVPAVVYGHGVEARNIFVDAMDFRRVFASAGESTIIELAEGDNKPVNVLIHDHQVDPLSSEPTHVDFFQIRMDEKIDADIVLEFIGESPAVKQQGGVLIKNIESISVTCLPKDLLGHIDVDLSVLKTFDDQINVSDLSISKDLTLHVELEAMIATVAPPRTEEELEALNEEVTEDVNAVEGVTKEGDDNGDADEGEGEGDDKDKDKKEEGAAEGEEEKKE